MNQLEKILKRAKLMTPDLKYIIEDIVSNCDVCIRHQRAKPRPVVGLSKSDGFNQTISMDLHELVPHKIWYLHMVDEFTRYSNAVIIKSKSVVPQAFLRFWISLFGPPKTVFTDNGGEFVAEAIYDVCAAFNIKQDTTPGYSPWSNGLCERQNQILTQMIHKVKDEQKCTWETALAWSVSAKNQLINNKGFSPAQLVYGQNGNFPSVSNSTLPGFEDVPESSAAGIHIAALHSARQAFIEAESSQKIKTALKKQLRLPSKSSYQIGDQVFYYRETGGKTKEKWRGPGKVIGQDGQVVVIRHGARTIKAHLCRVTPVKMNETTEDLVTNAELQSSNTCKSIKPIDKTAQQTAEIYSSDSDDGVTNDNLTRNLETSPDTPSSSDEHNDEPSSNVQDNNTNSQSNLWKTSGRSGSRTLQLRRGQCISFDNEDGITCQAQIMGRSGKATGKHRNEFNLEYKTPLTLEGEQTAVNLELVDNLVLTDPSDSIAAPVETDQILETSHLTFELARSRELNSWIRNDVYEVVPLKSVDKKVISTRWVDTIKKTNTGKLVTKSRLVARGFEETSKNIQKESPTCSKDSLRVMMSVICQKQWCLRSMDVKTAFLKVKDSSAMFL